MTSETRRAIVRVEILDEARNRLDWGTGFLVGPRLILTAYHVVADRRRSDWACRGKHIQVLFPEATDSPVPVESQSVEVDRGLDFAALRLTEDPPLTVKPLLLAAGQAAIGAHYHCWGFARLNPLNGFTVTGTVTDPQACVEDRQPALQLYANEASGPDAELMGLSGSPCIVGDRVFGVVRCFPTVNGTTVAGASIYACPASIVAKRLELLGEIEPGGAEEFPTLAVIVPGYDEFSATLKAAFQGTNAWQSVRIVEEDPVRALFAFRRASENHSGCRSVFFVDIQPRYDASSYLEMIREARAIGRDSGHKPIFVLSGELAWFDGCLRPIERQALEKYYRLTSASFDAESMEALATRCSEEWRLRPQSGPGSL